MGRLSCRRGISSIVVAALALGCQGPPRQKASSAAPEKETDTTALEGRVVSTVDGRPIRLEDVRRVAAELEMQPRVALRRLQEQKLLAQEARRRGLGRDPKVRATTRRAAVQALLQARVESVDIDEAAVRRAYEQAPDRFHRPERRASAHVLVRVDASASRPRVRKAREVAQEALEALGSADDVETVIEQYSKRPQGPFQIVAEQIPAVPRDGSFAEPYLDAVFSLQSPDVVPQPVRTRFGWHAIAVTRIEPAEIVPFERAAETLRSELRRDARKKRLEELLASLRSRASIERDPAHVRALLARRFGFEGS